MKVCSWSKSRTFQSILHMLRIDHLNIDSPPFPVKSVRQFGSALGGEVVVVCVCVCAPGVGAHVRAHALTRGAKSGIVHVLHMQSADL